MHDNDDKSLAECVWHWCGGDDGRHALQVVNFASTSHQVDVELLGLHSSPDMMTVTVLNSTNGWSENSFDEPYLVSLCFV